MHFTHTRHIAIILTIMFLAFPASDVFARTNDDHVYRELSFLERKEEILQEQLSILETENDRVFRERDALMRSIIRASRRGDIAARVPLEHRLRTMRGSTREISEARDRLLAIASDKERYEELLAASLPDIEKKRGQSFSHRKSSNLMVESSHMKKHTESLEQFTLAWPVMPRLGISAGFEESSYKERFGFEHYAVDIPVLQGTAVRAARSGIVEEVNDRGLGYNTLVLRHGREIITVYGHVSKFLVSAGQRVAEGQIIALSGGLPGTPGAGLFTTGAHLHFETRILGEAQNPLVHLPPMDFTLAKKAPAAFGGDYRRSRRHRSAY